MRFFKNTPKHTQKVWVGPTKRQVSALFSAAGSKRHDGCGKISNKLNVPPPKTSPMYKDINWDQVKVQASISTLNGLISSGLDPVISVSKSQLVADLLVEQLQQSILENDKQVEKRVDAVIHSIASKR